MAANGTFHWRRAIGEYLSSSAADVVTLQEVWLASDAALLAQLGARGSLRYHHYFQGGVMGGELLTLSKHPILEVPPPILPRAPLEMKWHDPNYYTLLTFWICYGQEIHVYLQPDRSVRGCLMVE